MVTHLLVRKKKRKRCKWRRWQYSPYIDQPKNGMSSLSAIIEIYLSLFVFLYSHVHTRLTPMWDEEYNWLGIASTTLWISHRNVKYIHLRVQTSVWSDNFDDRQCACVNNIDLKIVGLLSDSVENTYKYVLRWNLILSCEQMWLTHNRWIKKKTRCPTLRINIPLIKFSMLFDNHNI